MGAVLGFLFNWLLEGRKANRAAAIRWDDDLRKYAADLIVAIHSLRKEASWRHAYLAGYSAGTNASLSSLKPDELAAALGALDREEYLRRELRTLKWEDETFKESNDRTIATRNEIERLQANINLIAPPKIRTALKPLLDITRRSNFDDDDQADYPALVQEYENAIDSLVAAVRAHLRV